MQQLGELVCNWEKHRVISVHIRGNRDQEKSLFGHCSRSEILSELLSNYVYTFISGSINFYRKGYFC